MASETATSPVSSPGTSVPADHAPPASRRPRRGAIILSLVLLAVIGGVFGVWYWSYESQFIYTDKADVEAPLIGLAPHAPGPLKRVLVEQGDVLPAYRAVARVGDEMLLTEVPGIAVIVKKDIGTIYGPSTPVVTMIQPKELHVVARIQEDKGLKDVHAEQRAIFTVDAFGSHEYEGTVESVSQTNRSGDVVFNISDKREEQEFEVKIRYDVDAYPELQNGMSARVWIVK
jgi:multidrug resistance efflux pump